MVEKLEQIVFKNVKKDVGPTYGRNILTLVLTNFLLCLLLNNVSTPLSEKR